MFCKNCGREIDDKASICIYCGVATGVKDPEQRAAEQSAKAPERHVNGVGIAGFVLGLLSLWLGMYFCVVPVIGLVLSSVGVGLRNRYTSSNGLAIAGLVLSIVSLVIWALVWAFVGTALLGSCAAVGCAVAS